MIKEDAWAVSYVGRGEVEAKASKLSADRKRDYLKIAKEIGADFITQNDGDMIVWHWSSAKSLASVSKYKGIAYFQEGKKHNYMTKDKLDRLEDGDEDGIWIRHLSGQWCIIYMQND